MAITAVLIGNTLYTNSTLLAGFSRHGQESPSPAQRRNTQATTGTIIGTTMPIVHPVMVNSIGGHDVLLFFLSCA